MSDQDARRSPGGSGIYDAFVSYSHSLDADIAKQLQAALHRFAKPWYRLRAVRVFRDDASLTANPALWTSIQAALDGSRYFILIASPESARSAWVQREVGYWCDRKPSQRLLIAVTGGRVAWDDEARDFDWSTTTAIPAALAGRYAEEPRITDLRWARGAERLELREERFRGAVADLAVPLHGRDKDELLGDDVRMHRRAVALARGTISLVAVLAVVASVAALLAVRQRDAARRERDRATSQTKLAVSRFLASQAETERARRLDRALLLATAAVALRSTPEARHALLTALATSPHLRAISPLVPASFAVFSHDGRTLVVTSSRGRAEVWDVQSLRRRRAELISSRQTFFDVEIDAPVVLDAHAKTMAWAIDDHTIELWDVDSGTRLGEPLETRRRISALALSPDGTRVAAVLPARHGVVPTTRRRDRAVVRWWTVRTKQQGGSHWFTGSSADHLAFAGANEALVVVGVSDVVRWDLTRDRIERLPITLPVERSTWLSADGRRFVVAAGEPPRARVWNLARARPINRLARASYAGALSPNGRYLAEVDADGARSRDLRRGTIVGARLPGADSPNIAIAPDGRTIVTINRESQALLWNVESARRLGLPFVHHRKGVNDLVFSPDGRLLATAGSDGRARLWSMRSARPVPTPSFAKHSALVTDVAFTPDGRQLVSGDFDGRAIGQTVTSPSRVTELPGAHRHARSFSLDPQGRLFAVAEVRPNSGTSVAVWDLARHTIIARFPGPLQDADLAFSPDGRTLAIGRLGLTVDLWDVRRKRRSGPALTGRGGGVVLRGDVAFSSDGRWLAAVGAWDRVMLWPQPPRTQEAIELDGHEGNVQAVAFSPDDHTLASGDINGAIMLWDLSTRRPLGPPLRAHHGSITALAFSPDGRWLASADQNGNVFKWNLSSESLRRAACGIVARDLTRDEWEEVSSGLPFEPTCSRIITRP